MGGGAWPFLVGGVICLVNSDNERDLCAKLGVFGGEVTFREPDSLFFGDTRRLAGGS